MSLAIIDPIIAFVSLIEQPGIPALRIAFSVAVVVFLFIGVFIFRGRYQYFDRDPNVESDPPVARRNREELVLFVWSSLTPRPDQPLVSGIAHMT